MWRARQGTKRILALKDGEIEGGARIRMKEVKQSFIKKYVYKEKITLGQEASFCKSWDFQRDTGSWCPTSSYGYEKLI